MSTGIRKSLSLYDAASPGALLPESAFALRLAGLSAALLCGADPQSASLCACAQA
ncbi:MAG: hypothetical protein LBU32_26815 [Clostridiales bacterium]|nr:hypothetical protein [Clostridiales bacterium]